MTETASQHVDRHEYVDLIDDRDIERLLLEAEDKLQAHNEDSTDNSKTIEVLDSQASLNPLGIPKLSSDCTLQPYLVRKEDATALNTTNNLNNCQGVSDVFRSTLPRRMIGTKLTKDKPTAGSDWFDLPKTELTPELKRDLQLLRMRSVLDPKRHYKKETSKAQPPKYSQVGTIIEAPTEFFSGRIAKRDRKKSFVEEVLAQERENRRFESKYKDIQTGKQSGKRSFYKNMQAKRNAKGK